MNWRTTLAVMRKEFWHITRDRMTFSLNLLSPLLVLIVFGYSFLVEVKDVSTAVVDLALRQAPLALPSEDRDRSALSQRYVAQLGQGETLSMDHSASDQAAAEKLIKDGQAKLALIIPADFEETVTAGGGFPLTVLVDGSEPHTANKAMLHVNNQTKAFITALSSAANGTPLLAPIELDVEALFNPDLKPINGTIPGMIGMALSLSGVAVCAALTREKELGTFEGLVATPIRRSELLIGKLIPYVGTGMITIALCVLTAVYGFGITFRGNLILLLVLSMIFLFALMAYALLLSLFFQTQQAAMIVTMLIFLIPPFFLSGLFIPVIVMPWWIRIEAMLFPTTPFVVIMRGLFLQAHGMTELWLPTLILFASGIAAMALAIALFRKRLQIDWLGWALTHLPMPAAGRKRLERWLS
jgi:ABC-2 type transport system permease protein